MTDLRYLRPRTLDEALEVMGDHWPGAKLLAGGTDLIPLFQSIVDYVPAPTGDPEGPFQMLISTLDYSSYVGGSASGGSSAAG